jgi:hypothetical protein
MHFFEEEKGGGGEDEEEELWFYVLEIWSFDNMAVGTQNGEC